MIEKNVKNRENIFWFLILYGVKKKSLVNFRKQKFIYGLFFNYNLLILEINKNIDK